jgi:hypothetical protein
MQPHHQTNHNDVFYLIILITVTSASSNNTLPDVASEPKHVGAVLM